MRIDVLNVLLCFKKTNIKVGRLAIKNRRIYFEYDSDFLKRGIQLSPLKLPLQRGVLESEDRVFGGLFGVFNDSLPDGWGKLFSQHWDYNPKL